MTSIQVRIDELCEKVEPLICWRIEHGGRESVSGYDA